MLPQALSLPYTCARAQLEAYPTGGRDSFIATLVVSVIVIIITLWKVKEPNVSLKNKVSEWLAEDTIVKGSLLTVTFVALWLAIRFVLYYGRLYILEEDHLYSVLELLDARARKDNPEVRVKISFKVGDNKLTVEKWKENNEALNP